jgi:protein-tyrosine-phosphatase
MLPSVLFVCVHNAGRSQMAAALLDHEAQGRVRVTSAGSEPAAELNPAVVAAMAEIGLDLSREFPTPLTSDQVQAADVVITMGCGMRARSTRVSVTWTGTCPTRPAWTWTRSAPSGTTSASGYATCSASWTRPPDPGCGWFAVAPGWLLSRCCNQMFQASWMS